jgi:hypothetical protein
VGLVHERHQSPLARCRMTSAPLSDFFGLPVVELDGCQVFVGKAGAYASYDGRRGLDLSDRMVPVFVRSAYQTHKQGEKV